MNRLGQGCLHGFFISRLERAQPAVLAGPNAPAASRSESGTVSATVVHSALKGADVLYD